MKAAKLRRIGVVLGVLAVTVACGKTAGPGDPGPDGGRSGSDIVVDVVSQRTVDKVDLLFMIDNSLSMADKQAVLKDAVPDLVRRFVSPNCVNADGAVGTTPGDPLHACPSGYDREFTPIRNIHLGVITSSLGGHGSTNCDGTSPGLRGEQEDDRGHLIVSRPRFASEVAQHPGITLQPTGPSGFLDWNPPAHGGTQNVKEFTNTFQLMVTAAGEFGCGYESQLEAVYRFLADPRPYDRIEVAPCSATNGNDCAYPTGVDTTLLNQRKEFLRPDSLVGVVLISDENDCSIKHDKQGYYAARADDLDLPRSVAACSTNPNSECCVSCISAIPAGCAPDPGCQAGGVGVPDDLDPPNLRCFNQKKRFGIDFLYPTDRYVNALKEKRLCTSNDDLSFDSEDDCDDLDGDGQPDIHRNPLFDDLKGTGALERVPSLIFLAGIVGVPWQDIQAEASDSGTEYPGNELHFQSASQLVSEKVWDKILGTRTPPNGRAPIPPTDTLMVESLVPRGGNDGLGNPLAPPSAQSMANSVNSHEWGNTRQDDLQYACVFKLPEPRDCGAVSLLPDPKPACDCEELRPGGNNPLCQNPQTNQYETKQHFAKAYPGLRELQVLKDFGENAVVASICARNVTDPTSQDYGYRPAMDSIVDRMSKALTGRCLPHRLEADPETGKIPCSIVEVRPAGNACDPARNRIITDRDVAEAVRAGMKSSELCGGSELPPCEAFTLCTLGEAGEACHRTGEQPTPGWCYIDPSQNPNDNPDLVEKCPADEKRILRFVDPNNRTPEPDAKIFIACKGGLK